ncbi:MAG: Cdc6/Cdc18 family protein [Candidatus Hodarchaeales archaeon]
MDDLEEFMKMESVFKDENTLFQPYIPKRLPHRDKQIKRLALNFRPLINQKPGTGGFACNIAVIGPAGVGKTVTGKWFAEELKHLAKGKGIRIDTHYVDCYNNRTRNSILNSIMREKFEITTRGFGTEEIIDNMRRRLVHEDRYLILILDEFHILHPKDIKSFIHLTEWMSDRISVVMISRKVKWTMIIDPEISQRVQEVLEFPPYDQEEMKDILGFRAELAFKEGAVNEEHLEMISSICSRTSNMRHGIEILHRAGRLADRDGHTAINAEQIRSAQATTFPELRKEVLYGLNKHELYSGLGIARRLTNKNFTATTIKEAYRYYQMIAERWGDHPNGESAFRHYLDSLTRIGLIDVLSSKSGRGRGSSRRRITIFDVPAEILATRIEKRLEEIVQGKDESDTDWGASDLID